MIFSNTRGRSSFGGNSAAVRQGRCHSARFPPPVSSERERSGSRTRVPADEEPAGSRSECVVAQVHRALVAADAGVGSRNLSDAGTRGRPVILLCAVAAVAAACGGSGAGSGSDANPPLSADQSAFEQFALHGGEHMLGWNMIYGGGTLKSGRNYIYDLKRYDLSRSPATAGPQTTAPTIRSLDQDLEAPEFLPTRYVVNGQILVVPALASRRVSYAGSGVRIDYLSADGLTTVSSRQFSDYGVVPLSGIMGNAPEELQAALPIRDWIKFGNFVANAQWLPSSAYLKVRGVQAGDVFAAQDCADTDPAPAATQTATVIPCRGGGRLDDFFPVTLYGSNWPAETDFAGDGTISVVQGVRTWVGTTPLPTATTTYRAFFELYGNVYQGTLVRDGTQLRYWQNDGSAVDYDASILNEAAANSVGNAIITGASRAGSGEGDVPEVSTVDLFGIGGHGVNGSLAPRDLLAHYDVPTGLDGSGQTVAIVDAPGTGNPEEDLNTFSQYHGLSPCSSATSCFEHVDLSHGAAVPSDADWGLEITLDLQMVHAIAPRARLILVTAASSQAEDLLNALDYAGQVATIVSMSASMYGAGDKGLGNAAMQRADEVFSAHQSGRGVAFFFSSGDGGFFGSAAYEPTSAAYYGATSWYPASSPYVTAVGGTRINSVSWSSPTSEVAWQFSGGGWSSYAAMPQWQSAYLAPDVVSANNGLRAVPDVAAVADGQHSPFGIYYEDRWLMVGGTSAGAPMWAGVAALFGQYLASKGESLPERIKSTPGGFNGLMYRVATTSGTFHDIISGSNDLVSTPCPLCSAGPGYDDVTGIGTPDVSKLFSAF